MSLIQSALGRAVLDLLLVNVRIVNVITGEIYPGEIAIDRGVIVGVEEPGALPRREARRTLDGMGRYAVPGLIDSHLHIESSLVLPSALAEALLRRGVTTIAEDPHEIANATGLVGIRHFHRASRNLPVSIFFLASTCVPAAAGLEHAQGNMGPSEVAEMLTWEDVIGLAEVMDARAVVDEDPRMLAIVEAGRQSGAIIEGHNPMLEGRELAAYIVAGIDSDHTIASPARIVEKLRLGVTVQLQERYMSGEVMKAITSLPHPPSSLCLVTDDVSPDYLESHGHLDQVLRTAIEMGMPPMQALQAATINPAKRLRLYDRGMIAPGRRADIALVESLETFRVSTTVAGGQIVVEDGRAIWRAEAGKPEVDALRNSLHLTRITKDVLRPELPLDQENVRVRVIVAHPGATTTEEGLATLKVVDGEPQLDSDLALITVIARNNLSHFTGFLRGLGLRRGAIATTHAHDSHNLAVMGRDSDSMVTATNAIVDAGGGIAFAEGDQLIALVPLPIAGVISDAPVETVADQMRDLTEAVRQRGLEHPYLLMKLSTFTLPVSSGLRITDMGYVRAKERKLVPLLMEPTFD